LLSDGGAIRGLVALLGCVTRCQMSVEHGGPFTDTKVQMHACMWGVATGKMREDPDPDYGDGLVRAR
jgi:hypothetical protein